METNRIRDFEQKLPLSGLQRLKVVIEANAIVCFHFHYTKDLKKEKITRQKKLKLHSKSAILLCKMAEKIGQKNAPAPQSGAGAKISSSAIIQKKMSLSSQTRCGRRESNPHGFPHTVLSRTPIPIRLRPQEIK